MDQYKTKHYRFEHDPYGVQPVKITNGDGKSFYVMHNELFEFVAAIVRKQQCENVMARSPAEVLGFKR